MHTAQQHLMQSKMNNSKFMSLRTEIALLEKTSLCGLIDRIVRFTIQVQD